MVNSCSTFTSFAANLAKEFFMAHRSSITRLPQRSSLNTSELEAIAPFYRRNVIMMYNKPENRTRRLKEIFNSQNVKVKELYCFLCFRAEEQIVNGLIIRKIRSRKQNKPCSICRQAIYLSCWDKWHSEHVRGKPSNQKLTLIFKSHVINLDEI